MISNLIVPMILLLFMGMSNSKNPMKMSFLILASVSLMFFMLYKETGSSWFPLIFFILFTGGILMMFMILSSILPNEKAYKMKYPKSVIFMMMAIMFVSMNKEFFAQNNFNLTKSLLSSSLFFMVMTILILLYFFNSIKLNSMEEYSMRSFQCR